MEYHSTRASRAAAAWVAALAISSPMSGCVSDRDDAGSATITIEMSAAETSAIRSVNGRKSMSGRESPFDVSMRTIVENRDGVTRPVDARDRDEWFKIPPASSAGFDCYGVNVIANDIPEIRSGGNDDPPSDIGSIVAKFKKELPDDYRTYLGKISDFVPLSGGKLELSVTVPRGDDRIVQLIGLQTTVGADGESTCPRSVLNSDGTFKDRVNLVPYIIGQAIVGKLNGDVTVNLSDEYGAFVASGKNAPFRIFTNNDGLPLRMYRTDFNSTGCAAATLATTSQSLGITLALNVPSAAQAPVRLRITDLDQQGRAYESAATTRFANGIVDEDCVGKTLDSESASRTCRFSVTYDPGQTPSGGMIPASVRVAYVLDSGDGRSKSGETSVLMNSRDAADATTPCF